MRKSLRQIRVAARAQFVPFSFAFQGHRSFHHIDETLRARISQFALRLKFGSVFGKPCAQRGTNVNDCRSILHSGQCRAHKSVRCLQNVIALMSAARLTEIMHGTSFPEILARPQAASAIDARTQVLSRHRQDTPIPPDRGLCLRASARKSSPRGPFPPGSWHRAPRRSPCDAACSRLLEWHARSAPSEMDPSALHSVQEASATLQSLRVARQSTPPGESTHPALRFVRDPKHGGYPESPALLRQSHSSHRASLLRIPRSRPNPLCVAPNSRPPQPTPRPRPAHRVSDSWASYPRDSLAQKT